MARREHDFYPTPSWCVDRLLDAVPLPGSNFLEPCSGTRGICSAVDAWQEREGSGPARWTTVDINPIHMPTHCADFVSPSWASGGNVLGDRMFDAVITNPPYSLALDFVKQSLRHTSFVAALLRLNWLASAQRHHWLSRNMPDVFVIPERPSFTGDGKTDGCDYAWMVWRNGIANGGTIQVLDRTPVERRRG